MTQRMNWTVHFDIDCKNCEWKRLFNHLSWKDVPVNNGSVHNDAMMDFIKKQQI